MVDDSDETNPLAEATGPFYAEPDTAAWLGIDVAELQAMAGELTVLRVVTGNGTPVYPAWQFGPDRKVIPHLAEVLRALARGSDDPWTAALWLTATDEDDSRTAWQRLATDDAAEIIRRAHEDGARWAN